MEDSIVAPELLAAKLLACVLHDVAGPTSGLTSALDLLGDGEDEGLRGDAVALARISLDQIAARIAFARAAFAGGGLDDGAFPRLVQTPFNSSRARLELSDLPPGAPAVLRQGSLILAQISAESLAVGGVARLAISPMERGWRAEVEARGVRAQLHPDTLGGLEGRTLGAGLPSRWAPARYLHTLARAAGGELRMNCEEGFIRLSMACP